MFIPDREKYVGTRVRTGQVTMTGSAIALGAGQELKNGVIVKNLTTSTDIIYVGPAGVTTGTGFPLSPGESTSLAIDNVGTVYLIGTTGDKAAFISTN